MMTELGTFVQTKRTSPCLDMDEGEANTLPLLYPSVETCFGLGHNSKIKISILSRSLCE